MTKKTDIVDVDREFLDSLTDEMAEELLGINAALKYVGANFLGRMVREALPLNSYTKWVWDEQRFVTFVDDQTGNVVGRLGEGESYSASVVDAWKNYAKGRRK